MLRKTWKTLKFFLLIIIILVCLPHSILPRRNSQNGKNDFKDSGKENYNTKEIPKPSLQDSIDKTPESRIVVKEDD